MSIDYSIDRMRRIVFARGRGVFTHRDVFDYQREVWSRPDVAGFHELVDMTDVQEIEQPSAQRMQDLADLSAATDPPTAETKFAIVAADDLAFGLGRMYEAYRGMNTRSTKKVAVFRTLAEAMQWLTSTADDVGSAP